MSGECGVWRVECVKRRLYEPQSVEGVECMNGSGTQWSFVLERV